MHVDRVIIILQFIIANLKCKVSDRRRALIKMRDDKTDYNKLTNVKCRNKIHKYTQSIIISGYHVIRNKIK